MTKLLHPDDGYAYDGCDGPGCRAVRAAAQPPAGRICAYCGATFDPSVERICGEQGSLAYGHWVCSTGEEPMCPAHPSAQRIEVYGDDVCRACYVEALMSEPRS